MGAKKLLKKSKKPMLIEHDHEFIDAKKMVPAVAKTNKRKLTDGSEVIVVEEKLPKLAKNKRHKKENGNNVGDVEANITTFSVENKHRSVDDDDFNNVEDIVPIVSKKKRRKKTKTQELAENKLTMDPKNELVLALDTFIKPMVCSLEKEFVLPSSGIHVMRLPEDNIVEWFEEKLPKCLQVLRKGVNRPGCPLALVLVGSAIRAVNLKRKLQPLSEDAKIAKLFAKHMKIKDQVTFLEKNTIKMAIGTPKRISELLDLDSLSLRSLRYILLDWHWRDSKLRRMVDMPEVKRDIMEIYVKHFGRKVAEENVRIVLV